MRRLLRLVQSYVATFGSSDGMAGAESADSGSSKSEQQRQLAPIRYLGDPTEIYLA